VAKLYEGGAVLELTVNDDHRQIHNVVHGGVIATLADTAGAIAAYTVSPVGAETGDHRAEDQLPVAHRGGQRWKQRAGSCGLEGILYRRGMRRQERSGPTGCKSADDFWAGLELEHRRLLLSERAVLKRS